MRTPPLATSADVVADTTIKCASYSTYMYAHHARIIHSGRQVIMSLTYIKKNKSGLDIGMSLPYTVPT